MIPVLSHLGALGCASDASHAPTHAGLVAPPPERVSHSTTTADDAEEGAEEEEANHDGDVPVDDEDEPAPSLHLGSPRPAGVRSPGETVTLGALQITGGPRDFVARKHLGHSRRRLGTCYVGALQAAPSLQGTLVARLDVTSDGRVSATRVTGFDPGLDACVAAALRRIMFWPASGAAGSIELHVTFSPPPP
jgi:hypothetical protein